MRWIVAIILGHLAVGCAAGPEVAKDKSAVYGVVTARAHKELLSKWLTSSDGEYGGSGDAFIALPPGAIDYGRLTGIHVGLVDPGYTGGTAHDITFSDAGARPASLALAVGDVIRMRNSTTRPLTVFLAATESDAFQSVPTIPAGAIGEVRVSIEGLLDLGADEDDRLVAHVLARRGLRALAVKSGGNYAFNGLDPGQYRLTFWYWRLGSLERSVTLRAGKATRVDEVLSVDRTVR